jgi:hypothetical protein
MSKEKSKLELLGELFSNVSGKDIIISGDIENFNPIKEELEKFKSSSSYGSFNNDKQKGSTKFSVFHKGNTFHFIDNIELQNIYKN